MKMAVSNRYARALADVAGRGDYRRVGRELEDFTAVYGESAELRELFDTPAVPLAEKIKVVEAIAGRLGAAQVTTNFLRVLAANYRMGLLREICQTFRRIANERLGVVEVKIISAGDLSDAERQALRARFSELTGKQVEFDFRRDQELVGGILAQIGSVIYDGSVRGQLERIRRGLTQQ